MKVKKEVYVEHPRRGVAINVSVQYLGAGLDRVEKHFLEHEGRDDLPVDPQVRYSKDNGQTWSKFKPLPQVVTFEGDSTFLCGNPVSGFYDPVTGAHVAIVLRQTIINKPSLRFWNHCFCMLSEDNGKTWGEPQQFLYEQGAVFDPSNPLAPDFLNNNTIYPGNNTIRHSNGTLIHCGTGINIPKDAPAQDPEKKYGGWGVPSDARNIGSACFIGTWNAPAKHYDWRRGNCVWLPRSVSSRGLMEAEVAELTDGRVLVIWRGSNTSETPGRKWFSVSENGGMTLKEVQELKFDDGTRFYSPSSFHRMIRYSLDGKLYWIGNICPEKPRANSPRYPLVMAEVDESVPAIKRDSLFVIDDRQPGESEDVQISNFSLLENRETHDLEMYLTRLGAKARRQDSAEDFWEADNYKYTVSFD